jgi:hypothetical protein
VWAELVQEYGAGADLIDYDREKPPGASLARGYGIFYQPVFIVLNADGEVVDQQAGINTGDKLRAFVEEHLFSD